MGRYNADRYRTIMVSMAVYRRLQLEKEDPDESFSHVIERLLDKKESILLQPTRLVQELAPEAPKMERFVISPVLYHALKPTKVKIQNE